MFIIWLAVMVALVCSWRIETATRVRMILRITVFVALQGFVVTSLLDVSQIKWTSETRLEDSLKCLITAIDRGDAVQAKEVLNAYLAEKHSKLQNKSTVVHLVVLYQRLSRWDTSLPPGVKVNGDEPPTNPPADGKR